MQKITEASSTNIVLFSIVTLLVGIVSGLGGMLLALLLHSIQHLAYGFSLDRVISSESFLQGVEASSPIRRIIILMICGLTAGIGWWLLYRFGKPLVSIANAIKNCKPMPILATIIHALLQIITVALGSPLGREVAPREIGCLFAGWLSIKTGLTAEHTRIMMACGAGAGLAAVYNVPLGGTLFVLEALLSTLNWSVLLPAMLTSTIAVVVSWIGLGNEPQYFISDLSLNASILCWSILSGPLFGFSAYWYNRKANEARQKAKHNWQIIVFCFLNFSFIGLLSVYYPALLGNGKSPIHIEFDLAGSLYLSGALLILRVITTLSSLRAGAQGGLLTPSMANGALLGGFLGGLWSLFWFDSPLSAFALIGAAAFLAASQRMPLTAIALIYEFTRINFEFISPILFAVGGAVLTCNLCIERFEKKSSPIAGSMVSKL